jgi:hypothetical protein
MRWPAGYLGAWAFDVHAVAAGVVEIREANKAADLNGKERAMNKETWLAQTSEHVC